MEADDLWEVERRVELIGTSLRGFAYEGVTMAFTVRDAMAGGTGRLTKALLLGPAQRHIFLSYIGIGFAMARLPRMLWRKVLPDLTGSPYYPVMSWLAVDGYGFDRAYFDTRAWVDEQRRPRPYPWQGSVGYFPRAFDQGVGRALWFIHGARPNRVAAAVRRFDADRQADLWSGVGLAATFAGGCDADGLVALREAAGGAVADLCVGVVFAAKARSYAGYVPSHTGQAAIALAGTTVPEAVRTADTTEPIGPTVTTVAVTGASAMPTYEVWRQRIRERFVSKDSRSAA